MPYNSMMVYNLLYLLQLYFWHGLSIIIIYRYYIQGEYNDEERDHQITDFESAVSQSEA